MDFKGSDYVYKVIPELFGNEKADKPAVFHLKGISQEDFAEAVRKENVIGLNHSREEAAKLVAENSSKLVSDRVVKIENLTCDGKEITTYQELAKHAPRELVNWIVGAVYSTEVLSDSEIKN